MNKLASKFFDSKNAVLGLFLIVAISLIFNTLKVIQKNYTLQEQVDELKSEVALIEIQNQNLKYSIEYYKTDSYLEVEAKRRFNLASPGESVVFLEKDGDDQKETLKQTIESPENPKPQYQDNFDKWMIFLFGSVN